jgi:hypothetical protein
VLCAALLLLFCIVPYPSLMLYCALTGQLIDKSVEAVKKHMKGKKFQRAKGADPLPFNAYQGSNSLWPPLRSQHISHLQQGHLANAWLWI